MNKVFNSNYISMVDISEIVRGRIIDATITIENLISNVLKDFFAKPERAEIFDKYIMSDMLTFDQKKLILSSLIKYDEIKLENIYSEFSNDLQIMQDLRNIIAHTILMTTQNEIMSFNGSQLKYLSFSRKNWEKQITILLKSENKENENIKNSIYSFSAFIDRAEKISFVLNP